MQDELEDNQDYYCPLTHEYWCDLLSTINVRDNRKRAATQIKNIATSRSASHSDSDESIRVPHKKKASTGVFRKQQGGDPKQHGVQRHCVLYNKALMPEKKYMPHRYEDPFDEAFQPEGHQGWTGRTPR